MRTRKRKAGFTLVELMIVAAIIAILAAILIPLLASNRDSAIASEAANMCGAVATACKIEWAKSGDWPATTDNLPQTTQDEIERAKYFNEADVTIGGSGPDDYSITVDGGASEYSSGTAEDLVLDEDGTWSGSVVDNGWVSN
ncbi:MAG: prepilin-type N-terminal cleavage/methylation domain-containing protein [Kiritimatiellales bacterium]|nr:prepilin-type N-terminal cleavage/methylation domain-containing protein [Kiritimatiellota bacterium]MBL7015927.1 prepilin-type N-terminal cleavage/methylation domain-containing protein [Kiritimatiellales bacterium]